MKKRTEKMTYVKPVIEQLKVEMEEELLLDLWERPNLEVGLASQKTNGIMADQKHRIQVENGGINKQSNNYFKR